MSKYVIYNSDDDAYLNCGDSIHNVSEDDEYVEDVNDATLFNSLSEIWEFLADFDYSIEPIVLKVELDITPDHTVNHYALKKERDEDQIKKALENGKLTPSQMDVLKGFIVNMNKRKFIPNIDEELNYLLEEVANDFKAKLKSKKKDTSLQKKVKARKANPYPSGQAGPPPKAPKGYKDSNFSEYI